METAKRLQYYHRIGDTVLILGQRLSEWCGHGPVLEEDIAMANIALDYLGQATLMLKEIARIEDKGRDEDDLAFLREPHEYRNLLIVELPNGDYGQTIARQFLFSAWYYHFLKALTQSTDEFLKAFANKSIKEVSYHLQHAGDWVKRMGDGTEESRARITKGLDEIWPYTAEFFHSDALDQEMQAEGIGVNNTEIKTAWDGVINAVLEEAQLQKPQVPSFQTGSKKGIHTEYLGHILAEMQYLPRAYPGAKW
jgi:ring-1,2-phenylacetyl-CoA epoxidase subunit PaaC